METNASQWYCVSFSLAELAMGKKRQLARKANEIFRAHDMPGGVALFATNPAESNDATVYFSPDAVALMGDLLREYGAQPCDRPQDDTDLAMIVGDPSRRAALLQVAA